MSDCLEFFCLWVLSAVHEILPLSASFIIGITYLSCNLSFLLENFDSQFPAQRSKFVVYIMMLIYLLIHLDTVKLQRESYRFRVRVVRKWFVPGFMNPEQPMSMDE
ncbi:hypothetical protein RIF29_39402 [Crotalaria pallida]|uniref:Uncharacterized protein n=1 Tax=Crotalaria pallida TaxID=3830 RepID=A0AAN9HT92_CROPI